MKNPKKLLTIFSIMAVLATESGYAATITSFQNGEVFDGRAGVRDGIGDELFNNISSYFNFDTFSGQAMAYFDISDFSSLNISSAFFEWDVNHPQGSGAPSSTSVYGMTNGSSLSLDDFDKGFFLGDVNTSGFIGGDTLSLDITNLLQGFSGDFLGIRLASNEPNQIESLAPFLNMSNGSARIIVEAAVVPVPAAIWLFGSGLVVLIGMRKKYSKVV